MTVGTLDPWFVVLGAVAVTAAAFVLSAPRRRRLRRLGVPPPAHSGSGGGSRDALLDQIPDPIILVDRQARVTEANKAARMLLPALREQDPLSFALRRPDALEALDHVIRNGGAVTTEFSQRTPIERRYEVRITALAGGAPRPGAGSSIMLLFRDVTPAWRIERMRTDFVASASHELRTPLASILGFIETLQGPARNDAEARERFLDIMRDQAKRMTRLIDDLLSLARIEMRAHLPVTTVVDLNAIIEQVCPALEPLAQERSVAMTVNRSDEACRVLGDADELVRVAENVIENAIKYGESGGKVDIQVRRVEGTEGRRPMVEVSVRDYGPGIAAEHLPRLTERFYRVDPTASRQQGGTGLGLALAKHIVNRHRGRLAIESEPGAGTTVRVVLPEHQQAAGSDDVA